MTPERTWIEVDLSALLANARTVLARNPGARLLPMVKADAYGLGAVPVARALESLDPWGFGVATVAEGAVLRAAGIQRPILVIAPTVGALDEAKGFHLTPGIGSDAQLERWLAIAPGMPFHLEVDTGMGRAGYHPDAFVTAASKESHCTFSPPFASAFASTFPTTFVSDGFAARVDAGAFIPTRANAIRRAATIRSRVVEDRDFKR